MDEWLGSESDDPSSNSAQCSTFFLSFSLLAQPDICAAELATWGVGPDVIIKVIKTLKM